MNRFEKELAEQSAIYAKEIMRLKAERDTLLEALKHLIEIHETHRLTPLAFIQARAAIAKAQGSGE